MIVRLQFAVYDNRFQYGTANTSDVLKEGK